MAADAAREIVRLRGLFRDLAAVAAYYEDQPAIGWPGYHGAVALGLTRRRKAAAARFMAVATESAGSDIEWVRGLSASAASLAELVSDPDAFARAIEDQVALNRAGHRMRAIEHPFSFNGAISAYPRRSGARFCMPSSAGCEPGGELRQGPYVRSQSSNSVPSPRPKLDRSHANI